MVERPAWPCSGGFTDIWQAFYGLPGQLKTV